MRAERKEGAKMGQCRHCGSEVKEGERFCSNCGAALEEEMSVGEAAAQSAPQETEKQKPRWRKFALAAAAAAVITATGAVAAVRATAGQTGARFLRAQAEVLRQEAAPLLGLGSVFENGFSSDLVLSMKLSPSRQLALSRSGNEDYVMGAKILQRGIQARVDIGKQFESAVLNLEFGTSNSETVNLDCFLDAEKLGCRIPQISDQIFVLHYPDLIAVYSGGARFSTEQLADMVPPKELLTASAARYGNVLAASIKKEHMQVKKRTYSSYVLQRHLEHEMKGEYTVYTWHPDKEILEAFFHKLAAEMQKDSELAAWYDKRQKTGEEIAKAFGLGQGEAATFSDVADYVEKQAENWAKTLDRRNFRWKLVMKGREVSAIRLVDKGERPLFCYEKDQVGDTLYHGCGGELIKSTLAEERSQKKDSYKGKIIGRFAMLGDDWLWGFKLDYSKVPLDGKSSVFGLPNGSYRYTCFDADWPSSGYPFEVKEQFGASVYEMGDDGAKLTLTATRTGSARKPEGEEVDISDELAGSDRKELPQKEFSDIIEKL